MSELEPIPIKDYQGLLSRATRSEKDHVERMQEKVKESNDTLREVSKVLFQKRSDHSIMMLGAGKSPKLAASIALGEVSMEKALKKEIVEGRQRLSDLALAIEGLEQRYALASEDLDVCKGNFKGSYNRLIETCFCRLADEYRELVLRIGDVVTLMGAAEAVTPSQLIETTFFHAVCLPGSERRKEIGVYKSVHYRPVLYNADPKSTGEGAKALREQTIAWLGEQP